MDNTVGNFMFQLEQNKTVWLQNVHGGEELRDGGAGDKVGGGQEADSLGGAFERGFIYKADASQWWG